MLNSFTTTSSSLFKTLLTWQLQILIIFVLFCLFILLCWWKQYIKNSSVNQNLKQRLDNDQKKSFEMSTADTIRKIPLQKSAPKRRMLVSKPLKRNNKKSSRLSSSKTNKVVRKSSKNAFTSRYNSSSKITDFPFN